MDSSDRRSFIRKTALASLCIGLAGSATGISTGTEVPKGKRVGMIGLDTGHSPAFTKSLNDPMAGDRYRGFKVVAAYPKGTGF